MPPPLYHPRPERWPQVGLKGFFVLVAVLGVWLGVQAKWIRDRHEATKWTTNYGMNRISLSGEAGAPWSIRILGETGHVAVYVFPDSGPEPDPPRERAFEEIKASLRKLFPEAKVETLSNGGSNNGGGF